MPSGSRKLAVGGKLAHGVIHVSVGGRIGFAACNQVFHHWLVGRSIPTPDKIETLAKWLDTSGEWLRHGRMLEEGGAVSPQEALLLKYFRALSPEKQEALITLLHKAED